MAGTNRLIYNDDMPIPTATPDAYVTVKFNPKTFTCHQGYEEGYTHDVQLAITLDGAAVSSPFTITAAQLKTHTSFAIGLKPTVACDFPDEWRVASATIPVVVQQQGQNPLVAQPTVCLGQTATLTLAVTGGRIGTLG